MSNRVVNAIAISRSDVSNSDSEFTELPQGQKIISLYDLVLSKKRFDWMGSETGFLPRLSKLTRTGRIYSPNKFQRQESISALGKHFIDVDKLPTDLLDECIKMYHVGNGRDGQKLYHYACVGEVFYTAHGRVCSSVDKQVYAKFVKAICEMFQIQINPDPEYVKAELDSLKKNLYQYQRKQDGAEMSDKITKMLSEIQAWNDDED